MTLTLRNKGVAGTTRTAIEIYDWAGRHWADGRPGHRSAAAGAVRLPDAAQFPLRGKPPDVVRTGLRGAGHLLADGQCEGPRDVDDAAGRPLQFSERSAIVAAIGLGRRALETLAALGLRPSAPAQAFERFGRSGKTSRQRRNRDLLPRLCARCRADCRISRGRRRRSRCPRGRHAPYGRCGGHSSGTSAGRNCRMRHAGNVDAAGCESVATRIRSRRHGTT